MDSQTDHSGSTTAATRPSDPTDTSSFNADWVRARPHILAALEYVDGLYDEAHALKRTMAGETVLWVGQESALIVEIIEYPTGRRSLVYWLAGGALEELRDRMQPAIEQWAKQRYGVEQAEFSGRRGWLRALGFREQWTSGSKDL